MCVPPPFDAPDQARPYFRKLRELRDAAPTARDVVLTAGPLDAVCGKLVDLAMKRGGSDNITVIVGGVSGDLPALVVGESISDTLLVVQDFNVRPSSP